MKAANLIGSAFCCLLASVLLGIWPPLTVVDGIGVFQQRWDTHAAPSSRMRVASALGV
jgi:hypothetical protein